MLEILQRVQNADAAGEGPAAAGMAHGHGDDLAAGHDENGLSDQTIANLLAKVIPDSYRTIPSPIMAGSALS